MGFRQKASDGEHNTHLEELGRNVFIHRVVLGQFEGHVQPEG